VESPSAYLAVHSCAVVEAGNQVDNCQVVGHIAVAEVVAAVVGYGEEGQRKLVRRLRRALLLTRDP
tara:strand:+ start:359 stop:556 length:198 start_codon:yes stop_codon:yes gene_type:complete